MTDFIGEVAHLQAAGYLHHAERRPQISASKFHPMSNVRPKRQSARATQAGIKSPHQIPDSVYARDAGKTGRKKWDVDGVCAYIFMELRRGRILADVLKKLGMVDSTFYGFLDTDERKERDYWIARKKGASAMLDHVRQISEGRDRLSRKRMKEFTRELKRMQKAKDPYFNQKVHALERSLVERNKLQIHAAQWYAKVLDRDRFGDHSRMSLDGGSGDDSDRQNIMIEFVDPSADDSGD